MKAREILKQMTLEEKVKLLSGNGSWHFKGVERLGVRDFKCSDGPHGIRAFEDLNKEYNVLPATLFPCAAAMASTWNKDLIFKVGKTIGDECNHYKVDVLLAPGVNGKRNPLAGRNFEYYSEDPYLTGKIATNFINGVQSVGVGTSIKHFILNEQETARRFASSVCDVRTVRELYALPFEMAIKDASPMTVMCSYNRINGIYASESKDVLIELLRNQLNYKGVVISDWGAVQNKVNSINNGLNIEMPEPRHKVDVMSKVNEGLISETTIDERVLPILEMYEKLAANPNNGKTTDLEVNHKVAQNVSEEAIVLLKNDGLLPLKKGENVIFIGEFLTNPRTNGGGSASLKPFKVESPLEELKAYDDYPSCLGFKEDEINEELENEAIELAKKADKVILFVGTTAKIESEGFDRKNIDLPSNQISLINKVLAVNNRVVLVNSSGAPVNLRPFISQVGAILQTWLLGGACGKAVMQVLFGDVNPSGRLSETWPLEYANVSTSRWFPEQKDEAIYKEGLFTGYRYFDSYKIPVLFPFGFGLSYTNFTYSNLKLSKEKITNDDILTVSVDITNNGKVAGSEVVQLYVKDKECYYLVCEKYLKDFEKISLKANETKTVTFNLDKMAFSMFSEEMGRFVVETGEFEILIGKNVNQIELSATVMFESNDMIRKPLTMGHPLMMWRNVSPEKEVLKNFLGENRKFGWWGAEDPLIKVVTRILKDEGFSGEAIDQEIKKYFGQYL